MNGAPGASALGASSAPGDHCELFVAAAAGHPVAATVGAANAACRTIDPTAEPSAAAHLARLGVAVPDDLPAIVLSRGGRLRLLAVRLAPGEVAALAAGRGWRPASLTMYSSPWCGDCRRLKRLLAEVALAAPVLPELQPPPQVPELPALPEIIEVDIERDAGAEAEVVRRSGGRRVVPTLVLDGRVWAFNPEPPMVRRLVAGGAPA